MTSRLPVFWKMHVLFKIVLLLVRHFVTMIEHLISFERIGGVLGATTHSSCSAT